MCICGFVLTAAITWTSGASAQSHSPSPPPVAEPAESPGRKYHDCMALTERAPKDAFEMALDWRDMGGGDAAEHCAAKALIELEQYDDGARRLEILAQITKQGVPIRIGLLSQAAQAWLLAGDPTRAEAVATSALELAPLDPELMIDRAQARAARGDYAAALADLDRAIGRSSESADAFAFRATARRFLNDTAGATADANQALLIDSRHPGALLERGILRRLAGDKNGARADWLMVLSLDATGQAATAARSNLEKMDVVGQ